MKKNLLFTLLSIIILGGQTSCSKEVVYSCNKEANEWTKANLEVIQQMDRSQWEELEYDYQKAAYVAFSEDQRINLWSKKLEEVMLLDWSVKEKNHINSLLQIVRHNPIWFSDTFKDNETEQDNMTLTMYRWKEYATDTLNWNKDLIYALIGTPQKMLDRSGDLYDTPTTKGGPIGPPGDAENCNCNSKQDYCFGSRNCAPFIRCNGSDRGCGDLWGSGCDGVCL